MRVRWSSGMLHNAFSGASTLLRLVPRQGWAGNFVRQILPSFVADAIFPDHKPNYKLHPTSYLDGLRGIASFIVFFCHYTENNWSALTPSYGLEPDKSDSFVQLPYFRIIFSGRPMVHIFFVISGFVLSYKPIKSIHARDLDKCYTALASSTFRRAFRLFGPCIASTFIIMILIQFGYLSHVRPWGEQIRNWISVVFHQITWGWDWDRDLRPGYDIHLWTIPIEFAHSMLLFMVIMMVSRVRMRVRQAMVFGLMVYCLACGKWAGFEFLTGLFLAEWHVLKSNQSHAKEWESSDLLDYANPSRRSVFWRIGKPALHFFIIAVGLFLGGWPNHDAEKTWGIRWFLEKTPSPFAEMGGLAPQKFWFGVSAAFIVWTVGEVGVLKRLFEGPIAQYCGRISYAIYICHGPVLDIYQKKFLGRPFEPAKGEPGQKDFKAAVVGWGVKNWFGIETKSQITIGWFVGLLVLGPLVIWAADIFWRAIDNPVVSLGKKMENAVLDDAEPSPRAQGYSPAA
ncbi:acyltransferase 3 [Rhypophila decipiens]|uniref:Acyltransferase 3 n=1 Tax=Rhypophila decipiens TaxID=261697 RepID=A0AAN7AZC9_9PEZI|nr:acyltransferase 3 [Rhypophila decipiens]